MENKAHALAAGLFALLLGAAVILAAMWFAGDTYEAVRYVLESRHPVSGLNEQAAVRYRGVDIGKVTDIRFAPDNPNVILIDIAVQKDAPVTRETYAQLRYQGVTGLSYVMLDDEGKQGAPLPPATEPESQRIPVRESVFASLAEAGQQVLAEARELALRMNALLSEQNMERFAGALQNIETATQQVAQLAQAMQPAAKSFPPLIGEARKTLEQAQVLLAELSGVGRELAKRVEVIDRVAGTADKVGGTVEELAEAVRTESLPRINMLADELSRAARSVERLASEIQERPQSLVFGRRPVPPGPGEPGFAAPSRP